MSGLPAYPNVGRAEAAYLSMALATFDSVLRNTDTILGGSQTPSDDGGRAKWKAVCGNLRVFAAGANALLSRVIANKPDMDLYLFDMTDVLAFDDSDVDWAEVAGKGFALFSAGWAEHVGNQLGGSCHARTKAAVDFVKRRRRRVLVQVVCLECRLGLVGKTTPRNWPR
jgi:hypothetical protein